MGLSAAGADQAAALAARVTELRIHALYTSPVQRCRETARRLEDAKDLEASVHHGFAEVDYGDWSGRRLSSLRRLKRWQELFVAPSRFRFPAGESIGEMQARAVAACEELAALHHRHTVAVVSHADVIRALVAHYLGMHLDLFQRLDARPCSISVIDIPRHGAPRVPVVNSVAGPGGLN